MSEVYIENLPSLEQLDLPGGFINTVHATVHSRFTSFLSFDASLFHSLHRLQYPITDLIQSSAEALMLPQSFSISTPIQAFQNLKHVIVGMNAVCTMESLTIADCPLLETFVIHRVSFRSKTSRCSFSSCPLLHSVIVFENCFKTLSKFTFSHLPAIEIIHIHPSCFISKGECVFEDLPMLKSLYVGYKVDTVQLDKLTSLQHIVLPRYPSSLKAHSIDPALLDLRQFTHLFTNLVEELIIPSNIESRRDNERSQLEIYSFPVLRIIQIGNSCFQMTDAFRVRDNPSLESLWVGKECFSEERGGNFEVSNCPRLKEISILHRSFIHYSDCCIQNVPALLKFHVGRADIESSAFKNASLRMEDMPALETLVIGNTCFANASSCCIQNLPSLQLLQLGEGSCYETVDVIIRNLPGLTELFIGDNVFVNTDTACFESSIPYFFTSDIPSLEKLEVEDCFEFISSLTVTNASLFHDYVHLYVC